MRTKKQLKYDVPSYNQFQKIVSHISYCTPSTLPEVIKNYEPRFETSVSFENFGTIYSNTGVFEEMNAKAALAYKNEGGYSHFGFEGTTGANKVLFDMLGRIFADNHNNSHVLAARNVHQSVVEGAMRSQVPLRFIPTNYDSKTGLFLPPTFDDVIASINSETKVVLITRPNYEGACADMEHIINEINRKRPDILTYVDEAWGAHLVFNNKLPKSAIELGCDFVVQSIHKQGGGVNPANISHLGKRATSQFKDKFLQTYKANTSTSPSYPLLASMDLTRAIMEAEGNDRIETLIRYAEKFKQNIGGISSVKFVNLENLLGVHTYDPTKINLDVRETGLRGDYIAHKLASEYKIIVEKYERGSLTFILTFGLEESNIDYTIDSISKIVSEKIGRTKKSKDYPSLPRNIEKRFESFEAYKMQKEFVSLDETIGRVSGENIRCYPPGIYVIQMGEVFDKDMVDYLKEQREKKGTLHMADKNNNLVQVIK